MFGIYVMAFLFIQEGLWQDLMICSSRRVSMWMDHFSYLPVREAERHE